MWLSDLWQSIKDFWFGTNNTRSSPATVKKKFTVRTGAGTGTRRGGKRFDINSERQVQTPNAQQQGMIVTSKSRPRRCPRCGSKDTIIKAQSGNSSWECSEAKEGCGNKW